MSGRQPNEKGLWADRGDGRKVHYGEGLQPWDTIKRLGWEPEWLAGNIVKYLRRNKAIAHSEESARVYFKRLYEGAEEEIGIRSKQEAVKYGNFNKVLNDLIAELTPDELVRAGAYQNDAKT